MPCWRSRVLHSSSTAKTDYTLNHDCCLRQSIRYDARNKNYVSRTNLTTASIFTVHLVRNTGYRCPGSLNAITLPTPTRRRHRDIGPDVMTRIHVVPEGVRFQPAARVETSPVRIHLWIREGMRVVRASCSEEEQAECRRNPPPDAIVVMAAQQRILHQSAAAIQVFFHARASARSVAPFDRVHDCEMRFGGTFLKRTEVDAERHEPIDLREAALDQFHRQAVAPRRRDRHVEPRVGRFGIAVGCPARRAHRPERRAPPAARWPTSACAIFRCGKLRGLRRRRAFEQPAHIVGVVNGLNGDASNEIPVTNDSVEVTLLPQSRKPFTHRRAAHAVLAREHHL